MPRLNQGSVTKTPTGTFRARKYAPDGRRLVKTFARKTDAQKWLDGINTDIVRKVYRAPKENTGTVGDLIRPFLDRPDVLKESTRELYASLWRNHLAPNWEHTPLAVVDLPMVREWWNVAMKRKRVTTPTAAHQAYRLLRSMFSYALEEDLVLENPCRVKMRGNPKVGDPTGYRGISLEEVLRLAEAMIPRYRAMILFLGTVGCRYGETIGLRRADFTKDFRFVKIERTIRYSTKNSANVNLVPPRTTGHVKGTPKSWAGRRVLAVPEPVAIALRDHADLFVSDGPDALMFCTETGSYPARSNFNATFKRALVKADLPDMRPHDLRHTAATLAAHTGATLKELMNRIGHSTPNAALIYQGIAEGRDEVIADRLGTMFKAAAKSNRKQANAARKQAQSA